MILITCRFIIIVGIHYNNMHYISISTYWYAKFMQLYYNTTMCCVYCIMAYNNLVPLCRNNCCYYCNSRGQFANIIGKWISFAYHNTAMTDSEFPSVGCNVGYRNHIWKRLNIRKLSTVFVQDPMYDAVYIIEPNCTVKYKYI